MGHQLYGPLVVGFGVTSYMGHQKSYVTPQNIYMGQKSTFIPIAASTTVLAIIKQRYGPPNLAKVAIWANIAVKFNKITVRSM